MVCVVNLERVNELGGCRLLQKKKFLSIVVPCFNSGEQLEKLVDEIRIAAMTLSTDFEVILVDDCSVDQTWEIIEQIEARFDEVVGLRISRNSGQHFALARGIQAASGKIVVTIDDDGQNPSSGIPTLLQALLARDLDLIYGVPERKSQSRSRGFLGTSFRHIISWVSGYKIMLLQTNFRAFYTDLFDIGTVDLGNSISLDGVLLAKTGRVGAVSVAHRSRADGRSGYSIGKLLNLGTSVFAFLSTRVLRGLFVVGIGFSAVAVIASAVYGVLALANSDRFPGFASLAVIVLLTFSLQTAILGTIGIFLSRLIDALSNSGAAMAQSSQEIRDREELRQEITRRIQKTNLSD